MQNNTVSVTVTTHLSFDRLAGLELLASQWEGYISATIWVPRFKLKAFVRRLMFSNIPFARIVISLVVQDSADPYPINILRNIAIENSPTNLFIFIDVDFAMPRIPSLDVIGGVNSFLTDNTTALVLPAFEPLIPFCQTTFTDVIEKGCISFPQNKEDLIQLLAEGTVIPFHQWKHGQRPTNVEKWIHTNEPFLIDWDFWYEPYLALTKDNRVSFDDRFYDRGRNKMTIAHQLHLQGFSFVAHPNLFILHSYGDQKVRPYMAERDRVYEDFLRNVEILGSN